jgi:NAD(P)-dependent dehydrogenase (short-subunit alcohol dehydrogenase family)
VRRDAKRVANAAVQVQEAGAGAVSAYTACLSSLQGVRQLARDVKREHTVLDALVNNAGIFNETFKCGLHCCLPGSQLVAGCGVSAC